MASQDVSSEVKPHDRTKTRESYRDSVDGSLGVGNEIPISRAEGRSSKAMSRADNPNL